MKRVVAIALLSLYLLSNFGVSVSRFYCCGVLHSQKLTLAIFKEQPKDDKCCKHTQTAVKVSDSHEQVSIEQTDFTYGFYFQCAPCYPAVYALNTNGLAADTQLCHSPPLLKATPPLYMRFCTYRI